MRQSLGITGDEQGSGDSENQGKAGDFAQAYVISHEVGHHVQTLLGITQQVNEASRQVTRAQANRLSVMQELQADCFAGVWAQRNQERVQFLEAGDIDEAINEREFKLKALADKAKTKASKVKVSKIKKETV